MTAAQARNKIGTEFMAGILSNEESRRRQDRIGQIVRMSISQKEKQSLFAIVAG